MKTSNEPAEHNFVIQSLKAIPGLPGGGHVNQRQQDSGDNLEYKNNERGAAKHVEPAGGFARDGMLRSFAKGGTHLQASIEPIANCLNQTHFCIPELMMEEEPGVGTSPAFMKIFPSSIL